ncbi:MAG: tetratricopeptide repeat protein [Myxococcaceae bacterium]
MLGKRLVLSGGAQFAAVLFALASWAGESKTGWTEVKTEHVTLRTDLSAEDGVRAAILAERTRAELIAGAWPGTRLQLDSIELVVLSSHQDFQRYFGDFLQYKLVRSGYPPTLFLYGPPDRWEKRSAMEREETTSVLKEGLAQHLSSYVYRRQPQWFTMGLAEYLETMHVSDDGRTGTMGQPNLLAMSDYVGHRTLGVADALAWGRAFNPTDEGTLLGLYGLSWLMVQWMVNTHLPEWVRFQKLLATGIDPDQAWKVVLPAATAALDQELNHFAQYGSFGLASFSVPEFEPVLQPERPMSAADVHETRAEAALAAGHDKEALEELSAALAEDPGNVRALRLQLPRLKPAERLPLARRATATHPEDGQAWCLLGDALKETGGPLEECKQAYRKATQLAPNRPEAFWALASIELQEGRPQDALPLAQTAVRMAPWDATFLDTLAAAFAGAGHCGEAVSSEARAMALVPEKSPQRAEYAERLATLPKRCTEASPPPASPPAGPQR